MRASGLRVSWVAVTVLMAVGCGGDDGSDGNGGVTDAWDGIYAIDSHTLNETGCGSEGDDQLAAGGDAYFVVVTVTGMIDYTQALSCPDVATCRDRANTMRSGGGAGSSWGITLSGQDATGHPTGHSVGTGFSTPDGMCEDREIRVLNPTYVEVEVEE